MPMSSEYGSSRCPCGSYDRKITLTVGWQVREDGMGIRARSDRQVFCGKEHFGAYLRSGIEKGYWETAYTFSLKMWHAQDYWWEIFQAVKPEDFEEFLEEGGESDGLEARSESAQR